MNFRYITLLLPILALSACNNGNFKADAPVDPDDEQKYGFGSIIKGKEAALSKLFDKNSSEPKDKKPDNELKVENKIDVSKASKKDKLWIAATDVLKNFPLESADKKLGKIETGEAKIDYFDNTGSCLYKVSVKISENGDVSVKVLSKDDSPVRLKKHEEFLKTKILSF